MYCKHCGKQIDEDSVFCQYCGKPQDVVTDSVTETVSIIEAKTATDKESLVEKVSAIDICKNVKDRDKKATKDDDRQSE
jgi:uncharacterized membrane protein YvbJ